MLRGGYRRAVLGLPYSFSFNIADRCPFGCQCYWRAQARIAEMTDESVVAFFEKKRREGYVFATLVGGEPYVRPDLLAKVAGIIPLNWVVTSATTPLRRLRNTTHIVSIDGACAETHDSVRRSKGLYCRVLKNLGKARAMGDFPTVLHTTLNAVNYREIGKILEIWSSNGLADGINVSTLTPIQGAGDDGYRLTREQRIWIVNELLALKKHYKNFLLMTVGMIHCLHPDHTAKLTPRLCHTAKWIESYDAAGDRMPQCILSEKADCKECGCVITTTSDSTRPSQMVSMIVSATSLIKTFTIN